MKRKKCGNGIMMIGLLLIAAAFFMTGYNLWDEQRAGAAAQEIMEQMPQPEENIEKPEREPEEAEIPDYILNPEMEMPTREIDGNEYIGTLEIPALDLSLPVMSEWSYPKLKICPCRYYGSAYTGNLVIAGHNYRTHFSGLKNLPLGERIILTDLAGNQFFYEIAVIEILQPDALSEMTDSGWDLSLFTCTYDRQNRFTVRCREVTTCAE